MYNRATKKAGTQSLLRSRVAAILALVVVVTMVAGAISNNVNSDPAVASSNDATTTSNTVSNINTSSQTEDKAFAVMINVDGSQLVTFVDGGTVADALKTAGIDTDENSKINPTPSSNVSSSTVIDVTNTIYKYITKDTPIPFKSVTSKSSKIALGATEQVSAGENGVTQTLTKQKVVAGKVVESNLVSTKVIKQPVNAVTLIGVAQNTNISDMMLAGYKTLLSHVTISNFSGNPQAAVKTSAQVPCVSTLKPAAPVQLDANGYPVKYSKVVQGRATAYSAPRGSYGSSGITCQPGTVAINPELFPYGSQLYIVTTDGSYTYGYAVAADTGEFCYAGKNLVDLFFATYAQSCAFGVHQVKIFVLN